MAKYSPDYSPDGGTRAGGGNDSGGTQTTANVKMRAVNNPQSGPGGSPTENNGPDPGPIPTIDWWQANWWGKNAKNPNNPNPDPSNGTPTADPSNGDESGGDPTGNNDPTGTPDPDDDPISRVADVLNSIMQQPIDFPTGAGTPTVVPTGAGATAGNPIGVIIILAGLGVIGYVYYKHHKVSQ